jgi:hypothetical protein
VLRDGLTKGLGGDDSGFREKLVHWLDQVIIDIEIIVAHLFGHD